MTSTMIIIGILILGALVVLGALLVGSRRKRRSFEDVPPGMRPGYSDEQLEKSVIERYMGWGLVMTAFFAIFFPIYWVNEANRLDSAQQGFVVSSVVRGEELYQSNCSECHGSSARGGAAPSPYDDGSWPAPNLLNIAARYAENPNVADVEDYLHTTIERGRPGTPMPAWGAAYQGPLTDQDIQDITEWILISQENEVAEAASVADTSGADLFAGNCARCHGEGAEGREGLGPSLVGVFERHEESTVLGILRNGIYLGTGLTMPPWQNGYFYEDARYDDAALQRIIDHLQSIQPDQLPEGSDRYQTPGVTPSEDEDAQTADARG